MSIESRLKRGDKPEDVAKLFGVKVEDIVKPPKKKAAKKVKNEEA